ncbi:glucosamine-6-phosphate deaminase [Vampirovibrio sp.]|uniref:glucosamine-6-phosphate deaminase n=1 Tax=Vampirovibrio sp. TaxID=2717857 RepID=UPI003594625A
MTAKETNQGIHWEHLPDAEAVGKQAASIIAEQLSQKTNSTLIFPTGKTPVPMYAHLRNMADVNWEKSRLFQLDEYLKPNAQAKAPYQSFADFMHQALWNFVGGQKFYMEQYFDCPAAYEALVTQNEGPDLVILGIGQNGHIAFNEPGSEANSPTRVVALAEQTQLSNFGAAGKPGFPTQAITLGLKAILSARHILMLATGESKKNILRQAFHPNTPPSADCPASWLKRHPHVTILTDFEATLL